MKIIYSPHYDGEIFLGDKPKALSVLYAGNIQILNQLGLRAGIYVDPVSDMEREAAYRKAMENLVPGTVFAPSFKTDPMGVAAKLLLWRDNLIMAGWDGTCEDNSLNKLYLLAQIERDFIKDNHHKGMADYWREVCQCMNSPAVMRKAIDEIQLDCPWSDIPVLVQRTFEALEKRGVKISKTEHKPVDLQTGKIKIAHFDDLLDAYEWIAQVENFPTNCAIINRDNVRLNHTLYTWNKPAVHASLSRSNPQLLQLLKLCLCVFERPLNLGNVIAYLQLPLNPIPGKLRFNLASVLLKNGGFGDVTERDDKSMRDDWEEAIHVYSNEVEHDKAKKKILNERMAFLEPIRCNGYEDGIDKTELLSYLSRMQDWLNGLFGLLEDQERNGKKATADAPELDKDGDTETKIQHEILAEEDVPQLKELKRMFVALEQVVENMHEKVSYDDIEKSVSRIHRPISYTLRQPEKGSLNVISDIYSMATPADTLIWLDCQEEEQEQDSYDFLNQAERDYLVKHEVTIPDFSEYLKNRRNERNHLLNSVKNQVLLVQSSYDGTVRLNEHSLVAEVKKLCGASFKEEKAEDILPVREPDMEEPRDIDRFEPQLYYNLGRTAFLGRKESNSSLDTLIQRPFNYVMQYVAELPMPEDEQVKSTYVTFGLVAHHFFQHVIEDGLKNASGKSSDDLYKELLDLTMKKYKQYLDAAINAKGLILKQVENATQLHDFEWQLQESMKTLIEIMKHLKLTPVGCEMNYPVNKKEKLSLDTIGPFGARIDFVLSNKSGKYVIIDFKWSYASFYVNKLKENTAVQLELYRQAVKAYTDKDIVGVGYYMMPKQKFYTTDFDDWEDKIKHVDAAKVESSLFNQIQESFKFRKEELETGKIEESEMMDVFDVEDHYYNKQTEKKSFPLEVDNEKYAGRGKDKKLVSVRKKSEHVFTPSKKRTFGNSNTEPYETPTSHPVLKGRLK